MEKYGMQFKDMNTKQKVMHIWEYYRYHILATIIGVFVVFSLGKTMLFPPEPNEVDVLFAASMYIDPQTEGDVVKDFKENNKTGLDLTAMNWKEDGQMVMVMNQKIPMLLAAKELDILGLDEENFARFTRAYGKDMFVALDEVPELKDVLEKYKDHLFVYDKTVDENGNEIPMDEHVFGIKVDTFKNIPCILAAEEMVIGLNPSAKDYDKAVSMLKYILE